MNKHIMLTISIAIVIVIAIAALHFSGVISQQKGKISFHLYGSYTIDTSNIRQWFYVNEGAPFTCFLQVVSFESLEKNTAKEFGLDLSDVNFDYDKYQDKYLAITFGRELLEMEYEYLRYPYKYRTVAKANITFSEEYQDQKMYIYVMDKIGLLDSVIGGNTFYIMNGSDRVFWGHKIYDINEREPGEQLGL